MTDATITVPRVLMEQVFRVFQYYGDMSVYEARRTGGVLAGCPRGPLPTPDQLVFEARHMLTKLVDALGLPAAEWSWLDDYSVSNGVPTAWISVEERMPPEGEQVLVWCEGPLGWNAMIDCWDQQHEAPVSFSSATIPIGPGWDSGNEFEQVSHWMAVTPPPLLQRPQ